MSNTWVLLACLLLRTYCSFLLCWLPSQGQLTHRRNYDKAFFVSPCLPMGLRYEFRVSPPRKSLVVAIRAIGAAGVVPQTLIAGRRTELTDRALLAAGPFAPIVAIKTIAAIHWQAGSPSGSREYPSSGAARRGRAGETSEPDPMPASEKPAARQPRRPTAPQPRRSGLVLAALLLGRLATFPICRPGAEFAAEAGVQSAQCDLRSGLDGPLCADGAGVQAGYAPAPASTPKRSLRRSSPSSLSLLSTRHGRSCFLPRIVRGSDVVPPVRAILLTLVFMAQIDWLAAACPARRSPPGSPSRRR